MKKILSLVIFCLIITSSNYAQIDTVAKKLTNQESGERLMLRSKKQKNTGWVLLGTGIALDAIAVAVFPKDYSWWGNTNGTETNAALSSVLFVVGTAGIISSLPIFISSHINKRKARLLMNTEKIQISPAFKTNEWQLKTGIVINF